MAPRTGPWELRSEPFSSPGTRTTGSPLSPALAPLITRSPMRKAAYLAQTLLLTWTCPSWHFFLQMISPLIALLATGCHQPCDDAWIFPWAATGDTPRPAARGRLSWGRSCHILGPSFPPQINSTLPSSRFPLCYCCHTNASFWLGWCFMVFLETLVCYNLCLD